MQQSFLCPRCNSSSYLGQRFCGYCDLAFLYTCPVCGYEIIPGCSFCGSCGTKVEWVESTTQPAAPTPPPPPPSTEFRPQAPVVEAQTAPSEPTPRERAEAHQERSFTLLKDGHYTLAIEELTKAIEFDPSKAIVYLMRGGAYYRKGDHDLALPDLDKAIELDPDIAAAYYNRGSIYYYKKCLIKPSLISRMPWPSMTVTPAHITIAAAPTL